MYTKVTGIIEDWTIVPALTNDGSRYVVNGVMHGRDDEMDGVRVFTSYIVELSLAGYVHYVRTRNSFYLLGMPAKRD